MFCINVAVYGLAGRGVEDAGIGGGNGVCHFASSRIASASTVRVAGIQRGCENSFGISESVSWLDDRVDRVGRGGLVGGSRAGAGRRRTPSSGRRASARVGERPVCSNTWLLTLTCVTLASAAALLVQRRDQVGAPAGQVQQRARSLDRVAPPAPASSIPSACAALAGDSVRLPVGCAVHSLLEQGEPERGVGRGDLRRQSASRAEASRPCRPGPRAPDRRPRRSRRSSNRRCTRSVAEQGERDGDRQPATATAAYAVGSCGLGRAGRAHGSVVIDGDLAESIVGTGE